MRKLSIFILYFVISLSILNGQETNLVLSISQNQDSFSLLSETEKLYSKSAIVGIISNITQMDGLMIRTDTNDFVLRDIQKKSQIEASKGLLTEDSTYAIDKGLRPNIHIDFSFYKIQGKYQMNYSLSKIEELTIFASGNSSFFLLNDFETQLNYISLCILNDLKRNNYISSIPLHIQNKLSNNLYDEENFKEYLLSQDEQINIYKNKLSEIQKSSDLRKTNEEQIIRIKIKLTEESKKKIEENFLNNKNKLNLQKQQEEEEKKLALEKKQSLLEQYTKQRNKTEEYQNKMLYEKAETLSFEKIIEIIENDKNILKELTLQKEQQKKDIHDKIKKQSANAIAEIRKEPWKLGQLDLDGKPTEDALKYRQLRITEINTYYEKLIEENFNLIDNSYSSIIDSLEKQIKEELNELENQKFILSTLDNNPSFDIDVGTYNGSNYYWKVNIKKKNNQVKNISYKFDLNLIDSKITYKAITGDDPIHFNGENFQEYELYNEYVELTDLFFRTGVPFIFAELAVTVYYNPEKNIYEVFFYSLDIKKIEGNILVQSYNRNTYDQIEKITEEKKKEEEKAKKQKEIEEEKVRKQKEIEWIRKQEIFEKNNQKALKKSLRKQKRKEILDELLYGTFSSIGGSFLFDLQENIELDNLGLNVDFKLGRHIFYQLVNLDFEIDSIGSNPEFLISAGYGIGSGLKIGFFNPFAEIKFSIGKEAEDSFVLPNIKTGINFFIGDIQPTIYIQQEYKNFRKENSNTSIGVGVNYLLSEDEDAIFEKFEFYEEDICIASFAYINLFTNSSPKSFLKTRESLPFEFNLRGCNYPFYDTASISFFLKDELKDIYFNYRVSYGFGVRTIWDLYSPFADISIGFGHEYDEYYFCTIQKIGFDTFINLFSFTPFFEIYQKNLNFKESVANFGFEIGFRFPVF